MKILIAVDDRSFGDVLSQFVVDHEWASEASFKIIHVNEPLAFACMAHKDSDNLALFLEERRRASKSLVMGIGTKLKIAYPNATVEEAVVEGYAKEAILDAAVEWQADLIVMGSHGRTGLHKLFLGSVSQAVLAHAHCSVAIIRLPGATEKGREGASATDKQIAHVS